MAEFTTEQRKKLADEKEAMPDGSYPIRNRSDLKNAIQAIGRSKNPAKTKAWIKRRARELDAEDLIPESWREVKHMDNSDYLIHYGVLGMKWGVRKADKYQKKAGRYERKADKSSAKQKKYSEKAYIRRQQTSNKISKLEVKKSKYDLKTQKAIKRGDSDSASVWSTQSASISTRIAKINRKAAKLEYKAFVSELKSKNYKKKATKLINKYNKMSVSSIK